MKYLEFEFSYLKVKITFRSIPCRIIHPKGFHGSIIIAFCTQRIEERACLLRRKRPYTLLLIIYKVSQIFQNKEKVAFCVKDKTITTLRPRLRYTG